MKNFQFFYTKQFFVSMPLKINMTNFVSLSELYNFPKFFIWESYKIFQKKWTKNCNFQAWMWYSPFNFENRLCAVDDLYWFRRVDTYYCLVTFSPSKMGHPVFQNWCKIVKNWVSLQKKLFSIIGIRNHFRLPVSERTISSLYQWPQKY